MSRTANGDLFLFPLQNFESQEGINTRSKYIRKNRVIISAAFCQKLRGSCRAIAQLGTGALEKSRDKANDPRLMRLVRLDAAASHTGSMVLWCGSRSKGADGQR